MAQVDFNAGVVAAGEAQIESTVTGNTSKFDAAEHGEKKDIAALKDGKTPKTPSCGFIRDKHAELGKDLGRYMLLAEPDMRISSTDAARHVFWWQANQGQLLLQGFHSN